MKSMIKFSKFKSMVILLVVCLCSVFAVAAGTEEEPQNTQVLTELERRMQKTVSVDVSDVPIEMVIRQLAEQVDVDFIKSPQVAGNVTVTLTDVSVEEALKSILQVHGCDYIMGENVVRILSNAEMPDISEKLVTETFEIIYADVAQVVTALDKFKSQQGSVSFIQGTSHIIVTDTESKVRDIMSLIEKIDRITPQVLVEVRIYDITCKDNYDLGIEWVVGRDTTYTGVNIGDNPIGDTEPFITSGFGGATSKTASSTLGFLRFGFLDDHMDIDAQLRAEQENIEAKLLANPRILVIDNETALFDIVTEHPYIERTITGSTVTETVKFKKVGTKLIVTPHVTRGGMLRLRIQPEFGIVVGTVQVSSSNVPIVDTRQVQTVALIRDGQAVVLGGLRKKDTTQQINKIPLLGDLPILGKLFRFEGETTTVGELVVFITPWIVTEPMMTEQEQQAFDITQFNGPKATSTRAENGQLNRN